jgi:hypothetical protein
MPLSGENRIFRISINRLLPSTFCLFIFFTPFLRIPLLVRLIFTTFPLSCIAWRRNSVVDIATGYGLDGQGVGVRVPEGSRIFSSPALRPTQPPIQWVPEALSPGVKRAGRGADNSPPTSTQVKKMWIYTYAPPYAFMA